MSRLDGERPAGRRGSSSSSASRGKMRTDPNEASPSCLQIEDSVFGRRTVPINRDVIRLGRLSQNDIQLPESHVSKRHAEIRRRGDRVVIVDLESKAGTLVNGVRINERTLADGDLITCGISPTPSIVFRADAGEAARASREARDALSDSAAAGRSNPVGAPPVTGQDEFGTALLQTITVADGGGRLQKLARFLEFSRIVGQTSSLEAILENVIDLAMEVTGAGRGFLILKRPDGSLDYRVARGRDKAPLPDAEVRASETIVREVIDSGETRIVSDVQQELDLAELHSVAYFNLRSAAALPLRRRTLFDGSPGDDTGARQETDAGVFGVLYLDSQSDQATFDEIDRDILESLAKDASAAIENIRLMRQAEENRRMEAEMERAREVQAALLPEEFRGDDYFELAGYYIPSRRLGGDYLDQFRLPDGRCCLAIADVSGKGLPAALLAAGLQGAMGAEVLREQPLGDMVERINRAVCRRTPLGKYVTCFCCALSPGGELSYVNAGHVPPIAVLCERFEKSAVAAGQASGRVEKLFTGDMALGIQETSRYRVGALQLRPGDVVVLYTDGVTEAADPQEAFFEETRLEEIVTQLRERPAAAIVKAITDAVRDFTHNAPPQDDITLIVLKYSGARPVDRADETRP